VRQLRVYVGAARNRSLPVVLRWGRLAHASEAGHPEPSEGELFSVAFHVVADVAA
jgi:hypothetical protein